MRTLFLLLTLTTTAAAAPGGPFPDSLDTASSTDSASSIDSGLLPSMRTPPEQCSTQVLHNGVQLPEMPALYSIWSADKAWGTMEMVQAVVSASEEMAWLMPSADPLIIGDISVRGGGHLSGHKSHRAGVDADIGIFTTGGSQPHHSGFINVTPSTMDYEANWLFWRSLLETELVDRILLDQSLIDAMRRWTIETGELTEEEAFEIFPPRGTPRLWSRTGIFQHATGHQNHIHLRVLCGVQAPTR